MPCGILYIVWIYGAMGLELLPAVAEPASVVKSDAALPKVWSLAGGEPSYGIELSDGFVDSARIEMSDGAVERQLSRGLSARRCGEDKQGSQQPARR
jgi:hypothetical protein